MDLLCISAYSLFSKDAHIKQRAGCECDSRFVSRLPEVNGSLGIQPEFRAVAEEPGQTQGHRGTQSAPLAQQFIDGLARDIEGVGQSGNVQAVVWEEILTQYSAGVGRGECAGGCR